MHRQHVGWIRVENYEKYLLRDKDRTERIESLFKSRSELNNTLTSLKEEKKHVTKKTRRKINRIQDRLRDISDDIENMYFSMSANLKPTRVAVPSSETKGRTAEGMRLRMFVNRNPDENIKYLQLYAVFDSERSLVRLNHNKNTRILIQILGKTRLELVEAMVRVYTSFVEFESTLD